MDTKAKPPAKEKARKGSATREEAEAEEEDTEERKGRRGSGSGPQQPCCQADKCGADLTEAKRYHRRHKVCEAHAKAPFAVVAGLRQRFCQQCSRFHELSEFDEAKRSCRRRLAGHNERRRKSSAETQGESSSSPAAKVGPCRSSLPEVLPTSISR